MGDPSGIGPEVCAKAWTALRHQGPAFAVLGCPSLYATVPIALIDTIVDANTCFGDALPVLKGFSAISARAGHPDTQHAEVILEAIRQGVELAQSGQALALVTAPIAKSVLMAAGFPHPGHTEFLGELLAKVPYNFTRGPVMMLSIEGLRVVPVTIHCALSRVATILTEDMIISTTKVTIEALHRDFGIEKPRIAIAALNPHAGEDGAFGDEEGRLIGPAITRLKAMGFDVYGPVPADSLFYAEARKKYDAAVCMYHDQALIPLKTLDFWGGVNITLGLPIIRTSPDHGTGFDIAGQNIANPKSMIGAIKLASHLALQRAKS